MTLYQFYFSPTGGVKGVMEALCSVWDCKTVAVDLSDPKGNFASVNPKPGDVCLVAVPSFGGRVPATALVRLRQIDGNGAAAVPVAVFGNRAYDDTLLELKNELENLHYHCVGAVAAVAEHSIVREFGAGRPDNTDQAELHAFALQIKQGLEQNAGTASVEVPGNFPYREYHGVPFQPSAGKNCIRCGLCAQNCPTEAIPMENLSLTDKKKCITCMRCVALCPRHARAVGKTFLFATAQKLKKSCATRKQNELFL